jgi:hypothetical protein
MQLPRRQEGGMMQPWLNQICSARVNQNSDLPDILLNHPLPDVSMIHAESIVEKVSLTGTVTWKVMALLYLMSLSSSITLDVPALLLQITLQNRNSVAIIYYCCSHVTPKKSGTSGYGTCQAVAIIICICMLVLSCYL